MVLVAAAALVALGRLPAQNVDLSTVPSRDTVQLTIYNSEDLTLVWLEGLTGNHGQDIPTSGDRGDHAKAA
jgi:hypothetical protein